ncbi:uncharacterized protein [Drosophila takahashii]|uniref:uncharacterized protein n=1 Tax=Drosophila takahashii TaxID=29030 RepID=UPI0038996B99
MPGKVRKAGAPMHFCLDQDQETQLGRRRQRMLMFEEDRRRAAYRRYLAALRISYGNAISDSNKRIHAAQQSPQRSQFGNPGQPTGGVAGRRGGAESPVYLATSNAYSWQLSSPQTTPPSSSRDPRKRTGMQRPVKKDSLGDTNVRQYEMLQKHALANSLLAEFLSESDLINQ